MVKPDTGTEVLFWFSYSNQTNHNQVVSTLSIPGWDWAGRYPIYIMIKYFLIWKNFQEELYLWPLNLAINIVISKELAIFK